MNFHYVVLDFFYIFELITYSLCCTETHWRVYVCLMHQHVQNT